MRLAVVAKVLSLLCLLVSLFMVFPMIWSLADGSNDLPALSGGMATGLLVSAVLFAVGFKAKARDLGVPRPSQWSLSRGSLPSAIGGVPYLLNGTVSSFTDAFFEAMFRFHIPVLPF